MRDRLRTAPGRRFPLGSQPTPDGVNFCVFSPRATAVSLLLYKGARDLQPTWTIELDAERHETFGYWHVFVENVSPGLYYTWRVDGPDSAAEGVAFDAERELLDPWAREVSDQLWDRARSARGEATSIRARVAAVGDYDWEGDRPLDRPLSDEIIYELHVRGFTRHPSSGATAPGTFLGIVEKIPYLKQLGVTAVELLPVMAFDRQDVPTSVAALGLQNYWGYSTYGYFAVHPHFSSSSSPRDEFRDMVKALHREGLVVILDVVFNHTAEGSGEGPTIHFKGLANDCFYHLDPNDRSRYVDYTGCGNTVNCNHPVVTQFIVECLQYWVEEMHVDGFRFDLASVLARAEGGGLDHHARAVWSIQSAPALRDRILIAEPWDAVGAHQVGSFPGAVWSEWNDSYRDVMRNFLRGDGGWIGQVASRLSGSSDLYGHSGRRPANSINYMTCHDGFTLADLVSYNHKRNLANGEHDRDGHNHNIAWNSGIEGPTEDPEIRRLRRRRARNFVTALMLSQGVPMLLAGDERLRTQAGNNNAYCQDNELGWVDWAATPEAEDMTSFTTALIALRKRHPSLRRANFIPSDPTNRGALRWYGADGEPPDWHDPHARLIRFSLDGLEPSEPTLHVIFNMYDGPQTLLLPKPPRPGSIVARRGWRRIVDTSLDPPHAIVAPEHSERVRSGSYAVNAMSIVVFEWR